MWGLGVRAGARRGLDRKRGPMVRLGRVVSLKNGVIQTDCKLIRGDSGGPLFNLDGKLIGIHSRVGSGLEDNLHVPMKDFNALTEETAEGKTSLTPSPEQDSQPFSTQPS
ncbi:serine protease [Akkermansia muciniphila]|nr:serine protease [Akkermansia muciniphila]